MTMLTYMRLVVVGIVVGHESIMASTERRRIIQASMYGLLLRIVSFIHKCIQALSLHASPPAHRQAHRFFRSIQNTSKIRCFKVNGTNHFISHRVSPNRHQVIDERNTTEVTWKPSVLHAIVYHVDPRSKVGERECLRGIAFLLSLVLLIICIRRLEHERSRYRYDPTSS